MPRPPRHRTALRQLRETLGKSQKEFAAILEEKIGLPPTTYKSYEDGSRAVTEDLATKLMVLFGVEPQSIMAPTGSPKDLLGRNYSAASAKIVADREQGYSASFFLHAFPRLSNRHLLVLLAAQRKGRLTEAAYFFERAAEKAVQALKLGSELKELVGGDEFRPWKGFKLAMLGAPFESPWEPLFPWGEEHNEVLLSQLKVNREKPDGAELK